MLGFFRRHQRGFFVVVAFFVLISFVFFGGGQSFDFLDEKSDREIGILFDGSVLKEGRLEGLLRFLKGGPEEGMGKINILGGGFIHRELILSGLGEIVATHYFDELKEELADRWRKVKNVQAYRHPLAPEISCVSQWRQFAPEIDRKLEELKEAPDVFSKKEIPLLFSLYQAQGQFPAPYLYQLLLHQERARQIGHDPRLTQENVALFGFHSLEDWFGPKCLHFLGRLILNAACMAKEEGYAFSDQEAKASLITQLYELINAYDQEGTLSIERVNEVYRNRLKMLRLNEQEALAHWKDALLFKRLFDEVGEAVFLDRLPFEQFKDFSPPRYALIVYALPEELQFTTLREMLLFQRYIEMVSGAKGLELPQKLYLPEEIMETYPSLVYKLFDVEISHATKEEAARRIGLKQTWRWESEEKNFFQLQEAFPFLERGCLSFDQRVAALEKLDRRSRLSVDQYARFAIVEQNPKWIKECLADTPKKRKTLKVRLDGRGDPLSGAHFLGLLEEDAEALNFYTADSRTYYSIKVLDKGVGWFHVPYGELLKDGTLDFYLDALLKEAYESLEFEAPFEEVSSQVAARVYGDLFEEIGEEALHVDQMVQHRFDRHLENMQRVLKKDPSAFEKWQASPWALKKVKQEVRVNREGIAVGDFSPVENGQFFQVLSLTQPVPSREEIASAKSHLQQEAKEKFLKRVLEKL